MKRLIVVLFVLLGSCGQKLNDNAIVIEKTKSYHRANCGKVNMAHTTTISLADAIAQHLQPCPYCKPDKGI